MAKYANASAFAQALRDQGMAKADEDDKSSPERVDTFVRWCIAYRDAEDARECNTTKDWAHLFLNGIPPTPSVDQWAQQEWGDAQVEQTESKGETTADEYLDDLLADLFV